jgi:orotidine-5'-phosphate decarboxylase
MPEDFILMVPGIRPDGEVKGEDQKRVMSPVKAMQNGATHLVVGRPIRHHPSPEQALQSILESIN